MAVGFPTKVTYANGDVFSASDVNDTNGTLNLVNPTAKGSIVSASAANTPSRLTVGSNDTVLMAASGETTGLKWGGNWQTWTPTLTNITLGNGTVTARYRRINNTVEIFFRLVFGSTSSMGTAPYFNLPVNLVYRDYPVSITINDFGTANYLGFGILADNNCYMHNLGVGGTFGVQSNITSTAPMTWTTNDTIALVARYEVA